MRNIPTSVQNYLDSNKLGLQPINIVKVFWNSSNIREYADKTVNGIPGKILNIDHIDNIVNIFKNSTNGSVSITLDDTEGYLKEIFNNTDIHKKRVEIYQSFEGVVDRFLLFVGRINSPIIWDEGDRTLSFTVLTELEDDREIGFSPEEGTMNVPQNLIGVDWPIAFGIGTKVPCILINKIPNVDSDGSGSGSSDVGEVQTAEAFGVGDPTLGPHILQIETEAQELRSLSKLYFNAALAYGALAQISGETGIVGSVGNDVGTFSSTSEQMKDAGNQMLARANEIANDLGQLKAVKDTQESYVKSQVRVINGNKMPQNVPVDVELDGTKLSVSFNGDLMYVLGVTHPDEYLAEGLPDEFPENERTLDAGDDASYSRVRIQKSKFIFFNAGTSISLSYDEDTDEEPNNKNAYAPVRYLVCHKNPVHIYNVYARKNNKLRKVPRNLWSAHNITLAGVSATIIRMPTALSIRNSDWDDDIYVDLKTTTLGDDTGVNPIDVLIWAIDNYTSYNYDTTSFNAVKTELGNIRANFVLFTRKSVTTFLQEVAWQSRCAIYFDAEDEKFYIKYLPKLETSIDSINETDVIHPSLEVTTTDTEQVVTKFVALWRINYHKKKDYKIVIRYNMKQYGLNEQEYDFYIFNNMQLVQQAATFWAIRYGNVWKMLNLTMPVNKLKIETLDTVDLAFTNNYVANGTVPGIVESLIYNSNDPQINATIWTPVRLGEMHKFDWAFPGDLDLSYIWPPKEDRDQNRPGGNVPENESVSLPIVTVPEDIGGILVGDATNGGGISGLTRPGTWGSKEEENVSNENDVIIDTAVDSTEITPEQFPAGVNNYQYKSYDSHPINIQRPTSISVPCKIVSGSGDTYTVEAFFLGLDNPSSTIENVKVLQIDSEEEIDPESWFLLSRVTWEDQEGRTQVKHYIQPAVWL